jgi:glycosyltransferase involved in cell wall biosynthesis
MNAPLMHTANGADHTFVVPAYKESPYLGACLASLRAQTVASPIVIATSTPCAFIDEAARLHGATVCANGHRSGIGTDWNFALSIATTRFVTLAHQDDVYAPGFLACTSGLLKRHPDAVLAFTAASELDARGQPRTSKVLAVKDLLLALFAARCDIIAGRRGRLLVSFGNPISCSAITYNRHKLGGFAFSTDLQSNLDWLAWLTLIERGEAFAYAPERLVARRYNAETATSRLLVSGRRQEEDGLMFERLWPRPVAGLLKRAYAMGY